MELESILSGLHFEIDKELALLELVSIKTQKHCLNGNMVSRRGQTAGISYNWCLINFNLLKSLHGFATISAYYIIEMLNNVQAVYIFLCNGVTLKCPLVSSKMCWAKMWLLWPKFRQVTVEGQSYHKSCFKCSHGGCPISPSNYAALEGILYCKHHFSQLFKEKGSYNHLIKSASIKRAAASVPEA